MATFLKIIGWIAVAGFAGSFLYSTKFHLENYLLQKQRIKSEEVGDTYKEMGKKFNWRAIILFQVIKLAIVIILLFLLL